MPVYEYTAINAGGKSITGIIDADSGSDAREKLRAGNIFPVSITEAYGAGHSLKKRKRLDGIRLFSGIKPRELTSTTRQLATLVGAGFPLVSAIYSLIPQTNALGLKKVLSRIKDSVEEGNSFAEALSEFPDIFPPLYINMIRAGEASGTLEIVLERLAEINKNRQVQKNRIISILAYPAVMTILCCAILIGLLIFIVPQFIETFSAMNQVLPLPTRIIKFISDQLAAYWWCLLIILIGGYIAFIRIKKTARGKFLIHKAILTARMLIPGTCKMALWIRNFPRAVFFIRIKAI